MRRWLETQARAPFAWTRKVDEAQDLTFFARFSRISHRNRRAGCIILALVLGVGVAVPAGSGDAPAPVRVITGPPGSSTDQVMAFLLSFAAVDSDRVRVSVSHGTNMAIHMVEAAKGQRDIVLSSPELLLQMIQGQGVFGWLEDAPALSQDLGLVFWFPAGAWHFVVHGDSDIRQLSDLRRRRVFPGPPGSVVRQVALEWIKAATGLVPGIDFVIQKADPESAKRAFRSREIDVYVTAGIPPFPEVDQIARKNHVRLLGLSPEEAAALPEWAHEVTNSIGRRLEGIPENVYSRRVANTRPVYTVAAIAGVVARMDFDERLVYEMTRHFWDNMQRFRSEARYMERVTLDRAFDALSFRLHPGALRYYAEIGLDVPPVGESGTIAGTADPD